MTTRATAPSSFVGQTPTEYPPGEFPHLSVARLALRWAKFLLVCFGVFVLPWLLIGVGVMAWRS